MRLSDYALRDYAIVAEAVVLLGLARLALAVIPFRYLAPWLGSKAPGGNVGEVRIREAALRIGWAVRTGARRGPIPAVCFPRALAACMMLRRRGVSPTLYLGIAKDGDGLLAHAWVMAGGMPVVGTENAGDFSVIATFPSTALAARHGSTPDQAS